jgi:hypothetical protein
MKTELPLELLEQMAALMDGRLAEPERSRLLARISESEELYQLLMEAGELVGEEDESNGVGGGRVHSPEAGRKEADDPPLETPDGSQVAVDEPLRPVRRPVLWVLPVIAAAALAALLLIQPQSPGRQLAWDLANPTMAPVPFQWQEVRGEVEEGAVIRVGGRWFTANAAARAGLEEAAYVELAAMQAELARYGMPSLSAIVEVMVAGRSFDQNRMAARLEEDLRRMDPAAFDAGLSLAAIRTAALRGSSDDVARLLEELSAEATWLETRMGSEFLEGLEGRLAAGDLPGVAAQAERALVLLGSVG